MLLIKPSNCIQNKILFESKLSFWVNNSKSFRDLNLLIKKIQSDFRDENYLEMMITILTNMDKMVMGNSVMLFDITKDEAMSVANFLKNASPQAATKMAQKLVDAQSVQEIAKQAIVDEVKKQQVLQNKQTHESLKVYIDGGYESALRLLRQNSIHYTELGNDELIVYNDDNPTGRIGLRLRVKRLFDAQNIVFEIIEYYPIASALIPQNAHQQKIADIQNAIDVNKQQIAEIDNVSDFVEKIFPYIEKTNTDVLFYANGTLPFLVENKEPQNIRYFDNNTRILKLIENSKQPTAIWTHKFEVTFEDGETDVVTFDAKYPSNIGKWLIDNCDIEPTTENIEKFKSMLD